MSRSHGLRALAVDGVRYLWKVDHQHRVRSEAPAGEGRCREVFSAFREGRKASPLRVEFTDGPHQHAGYPEKGVVWTSGERPRSANLNTPAVAARLIRAGVARGWTPETSRRPFVVANGFAWMGAGELDAGE